ncbi:N-terminal EF-hand calcium-binding protein 1-like [Mizuhopecten yessoensis]|uniref:N-terminal EF-hand calcium-binding protein 1 n=1 Tax=Mizuhopecten yessoensis TaxID=6573 RepID=A0A210QMZ8_MIZYE|nr:N-terminal EF-hand calcium-binding protein 1-like [Mizuhopecten yessoensis]OWF50114.1 N-terminal EF-hand calcium-binding protein 1 [Mizuhopecten yessoensis]
MDQEKGMSIFKDVFRRADKNDDGAISWEEFVAFFSDGVMGKEELESLFKEIDTHNTNNIDTGELHDYFCKHLGQFKELYDLVEEFNTKLTNVLVSTSQTYPTAGRKDKFITRFLVREMWNQMTAVQLPLESASESLDEQAKQEREDITPVQLSDLKKKDGDDIVPGRVGRRAKRQASNQSQSSVNTDGLMTPVNPLALTSQVDRLTTLLNRLEHSVDLGNFVDEDLNALESDKLLLLQRDMKVKEDSKDVFRTSLRDYIEDTQKLLPCLSISVQFCTDSGVFTVYEVWRSAEDQACYSEDPAKSFTERFKDFLDTEVPMRKVDFPSKWWKRD